MPPSLTRQEAEALVKRVLSFGKADQARVNIASGWTGNTRFVASEITTAGGTADTTVTVTSTIGRRRASATTNVLEDESLKRTVELSERLARLSPEDPELMPELDAQSYPTVNGFVERTAQLTAEDRARAARQVLEGELVRANSLQAAGYVEANAGAVAVGTGGGLFAYHPSTDVTLSTTVRTPDGTGSGYAAAAARNWTEIDAAALGARASRKALASRNPQAIEPGQYTVVLEPQAVAGMIPLLAASFAARQADEGRSPFAKAGGGNKLGEKIADERVTIYTDPADSQVLGRPFDNEGLPTQRTLWVENGVLKNLAYTRFWAQKQGKTPTGVAFGGFGGIGAAGLKMEGGTKTVDELVAETERGILVTRFWYIRFLDQRTVLLTGLTRDGTFLIENGKTTRSLKNFRWNESPLFMINKLEALGRPERTAAGVVMPSMRVRDFTFTSLS
ncbi:MAG: TldD/PmbA family protein, partial [Gemmatimonadaceae bacterium]